MRVHKIFNNNVVLAEDERGDEVVLMGRGLGFQQRPGDIVRDQLIDRRFVPGKEETPERLAGMVSAIPEEDLELAEEIVQLAEGELHLADSKHLLLPLADHISLALRRASEGATFAYPLRNEVMLLYPREVAVARAVLKLIHQRRGVELPDIEAIPLSLHFVNAQFNESSVSRVMQITETIAAVLDLIGAKFGMELSEDNLDVSRFVTHLRYLFVRQQSGVLQEDGHEALLQALEASVPEAVVTSAQLQDLFSERFAWKKTLDERLYLALHIARLIGSRD